MQVDSRHTDINFEIVRRFYIFAFGWKFRFKALLVSSKSRYKPVSVLD
jgi:hypothetical protein